MWCLNFISIWAIASFLALDKAPDAPKRSKNTLATLLLTRQSAENQAAKFRNGNKCTDNNLYATTADNEDEQRERSPGGSMGCCGNPLGGTALS